MRNPYVRSLPESKGIHLGMSFTDKPIDNGKIPVIWIAGWFGIGQVRINVNPEDIVSVPEHHGLLCVNTARNCVKFPPIVQMSVCEGIEKYLDQVGRYPWTKDGLLMKLTLESLLDSGIGEELGP